MPSFIITPGIGNQMFQLAAAARHHLPNRQHASLLASRKYIANKHGGITIANFPFIQNCVIQSTDIIEDLIYFTWQRMGHKSMIGGISEILGVCIEPPSGLREENPFLQNKKISKSKIACGYWQNFGYAETVSNLRKVINITTLNKFKETIQTNVQNAIHIRAGDYQKGNIYFLPDINFYSNCLKNSRNRSADWTIFSDEIHSERVQKIYRELINIGFRINLSIGKSVIEEFVAMSFAKSLICANSTFSVSAAYLNDISTSDKGEIFVPNVWFNDAGVNTPDMLSPRWYRF